MTERLTVSDVQKAFTGYFGMPPEYKQRVHDSAERAISTYNEMLEKAKHSLEDLGKALEGLMDNSYNNMADPEQVSRIEIDINESKEWVDRLARDIIQGKIIEEERL